MDADLGYVGDPGREAWGDQRDVAVAGHHRVRGVDPALLDAVSWVGMDVADHPQPVAPAEVLQRGVAHAVEIDPAGQAVRVEVVVEGDPVTGCGNRPSG
ncbi:MAG: hypothetical protein QOH97_4872 [Actinoplanes sp.]|nr:hypothetical protein [Actinoplanes sp.]